MLSFSLFLAPVPLNLRTLIVLVLRTFPPFLLMLIAIFYSIRLLAPNRLPINLKPAYILLIDYYYYCTKLALCLSVTDLRPMHSLFHQKRLRIVEYLLFSGIRTISISIHLAVITSTALIEQIYLC